MSEYFDCWAGLMVPEKQHLRRQSTWWPRLKKWLRARWDEMVHEGAY